MALQEGCFAAVLRLVVEGLRLHAPPFAPPPFRYDGAGERYVSDGEPHSTESGQGRAYRVLIWGFLCQKTGYAHRKDTQGR